MKRLDTYKKIIKMLLESDTPIPVSQIASEVNLSKKTIYSYLSRQDFKGIIKNGQVIKKPNVGIIVEMEKQEKEKVLNSLNKESYKLNYSSDKNDRVNNILEFLLKSPKVFNTTYLANELYVSKSTVLNDLTIVESILNTKNIKLIKKENVGIFLEGKEGDIRKLFANFIKNDYLINSDNEIQEKNIDRRLSRDNLIKLKSIFPSTDVSVIIDCIKLAEKILNNKITDTDFNSIVINIDVLLNRFKFGYIVEEADNAEQIKETKQYLAALLIKTKLLNELKIPDIPESEVVQIAKYLLSARIENKMIDVSNLDITTAKKFVKKISEQLGVDLSNDDQLMKSLMKHLTPAIERFKLGINYENPLLDKIRYEYMPVYIAVLTSIEILEKEDNVAINENEIGYICLHIVTAIERRRNKPNLKACIVCDSGITIAKYIEIMLENKFKNLDIENIYDSGQVNSEIVDKYDLILTTSNLYRLSSNKIIRISNFVEENDINEINSFIEKNYSHSLMNKNIENSIFEQTLVFIEEGKFNKYDLINKYSHILENLGYVEPGYVESICAREKRASTAIARGLATPHGDKELVRESCLMVIKLLNPIKWEEQMIDLVFILAVDFKNLNQTKAFFKKLNKIIGSNKALKIIRDAATTEEIKKYLIYGVNTNGNK